MIIGQVIRLGGNLVMTRILVPEMFGVMSIVVAVQVTVALLLDIGIRTAIIQSPRGEDPELLNTAWTVQIIRCVLIWCVTAVLAACIPLAIQIGLLPAGSTWTAPELPLILIVASLGIVIHGFESTNAVTSERKLSLKRFVLIQLAGQVGGLILMIVLGLLTRSIWALVASGLGSGLIVLLLTHTWLPGIRNTFAWDKGARAELAKYGSWILLSSSTSVLASNADRIILGALVDATTMGLYSIAFNLAMLATGIGSMANSVALPALSEQAREDRGGFRAKYFKLRLPWDVLLLVSCGALFVLGPTLVKILYDDRYLRAGEMLQILTLSLIFYRYNFTNLAYIAAGKLSFVAILNTAKLVTIVVFLFLFYHWFGINGALFAIALHMLPIVPVMFYLNRELDLNSLKFEALVLLAVPVGYGMGWIVLLLANLFIT